MKLVYGYMEHIISFEAGYASELIIENKKMFRELVNSLVNQIEGQRGDAVLSIDDKPVEMSKYADISMQFAPFEFNRKSLLTKLYSYLEREAVSPDMFLKTTDIITNLELFLSDLSDDLPFEIECKKLAIGNIVRAVSPEFVSTEEGSPESILNYMEIIRELDKDKLFIMVNMRAYFDDIDMQSFIDTACLHDFKLLLLESASYERLKNTRRYTVDKDLCEF